MRGFTDCDWLRRRFTGGTSWESPPGVKDEIPAGIYIVPRIGQG